MNVDRVVKNVFEEVRHALAEAQRGRGCSF